MTQFHWIYWAKLLVVFLSSAKSARSFIVTPSLPLSFFFDWGNTDPFTRPISEQCETLNITWGRSAATGPNPTAPYFLQVYSSNFIQPFVIPAGDGLAFDWQVPFAPGSLFQICMFDKFGNTGGCQETFTIIESKTSVTCPNVTFVPQLQVEATVANGHSSQYGIVDQCTDISLKPTSGTPPYTLTVAPALHPPFNITSFDPDKPINWTNSLSWASPFFISLADSKGSMWSNGPLHSGGGGTLTCLAGNATSTRDVRAPVAIGVSFLTLFIGIGLGLASLYFFMKQRERRNYPEINPFQTEEERAQNTRQVYVLHHDDNGPPVTIISNEQAEIVELPPRYHTRPEINTSNVSRAERSSPSSASTVYSPYTEPEEAHYNPRGPLGLHQPRRPSILPRKGSASSTWS